MVSFARILAAVTSTWRLLYYLCPFYIIHTPILPYPIPLTQCLGSLSINGDISRHLAQPD